MAVHVHTSVHTILLVDVDGTLRGPGEVIGKGVPEFLREQVRKGVGVVPCSGKSAPYLDELFKRIEVPILAIGAENGGHIVYDPHGPAFDEVSLADVWVLREVQDHLEMCPKCNSWIAVEPKRTIITRRFGNHARAVEKARVWQRHVSRLLDRPVAVYTYPPADDAVDLVVNPHNVKKERVVQFLRARHPHARLIVAGDGLNDLSMMMAPQVMPVCPANAASEVQEAVWRQRGVIAKESYGAGTMEALRTVMRMGRQIDLFDSAGAPA